MIRIIAPRRPSTGTSNLFERQSIVTFRVAVSIGTFFLLLSTPLMTQAQNKQTSTRAQNNNTTDRYKSIYDDFVSQQNLIKQQLTDRLNTLNLEIQQVRDKPGGLFSNKKKDIEH